MENENPPAEKLDDWAHPGETHHWVWHMRGGMPIGVGLCDLKLCDAINWDQLEAEVRAKVEGSWQAKLVANLDRCPHGRHEGDRCDGWTGPGPLDGGCYGGWSTGNPIIRQGITFAWGLSGQTKYAMPERDERSEGKSWVKQG